MLAYCPYHRAITDVEMEDITVDRATLTATMPCRAGDTPHTLEHPVDPSQVTILQLQGARIADTLDPELTDPIRRLTLTLTAEAVDDWTGDLDTLDIVGEAVARQRHVDRLRKGRPGGNQ